MTNSWLDSIAQEESNKSPFIGGVDYLNALAKGPTPEVTPSTTDRLIEALKAIPGEAKKQYGEVPLKGFQFLGELAADAALWVPGWLSSLAYTPAQKIKESFSEKPKSSAAELKKEAAFVREAFHDIVPRSKDPAIREATEIVGKGFDKALGWTEDLNKWISGTGSVENEIHPYLGDVVQFLAELATFKAVHSIGRKANGALKRAASKANKGELKSSDLDAELIDVFKDSDIRSPTPEELKTSQGRQAYINEVMPDSLRTAEGRQELINAITARRPDSPVAQKISETISTAPSVISGQAGKKAESGMPSKILDEITPIERELPEHTKRLIEKTKEINNIRKREDSGKTLANEFNISVPGHELKFDAVYNPGAGFPIMYQFTPQEGPYRGRTFTSRTLDLQDVGEAFERLIGEELKPIGEIPSVQKLNEVVDTDIMSVKASQNEPTPIDLDRLPDWVEIELEGIYKDKNAPKRISEIAKQLLETGELNSPGLVKTFKKWYNKNKVEQEAIETPIETDRVDPERGRPPGGFEPPNKPIIPSDYHLKQEVLMKSGPLRNSAGRIIKDKLIAEIYMEDLGIDGKLIKDGDGWRIRKSKAERDRFEEELRKDYEQQLRDEGLEEIEPESTQKLLDIYDIISNKRGEVNIDIGKLFNIIGKSGRRLIAGGYGVEGFADRRKSLKNYPESMDRRIKKDRRVFKAVRNNQGEIRITAEQADKLRELFQSGRYKANDLARSLRAKGVPERDIKKIFSDSSVQLINKGESKWLRKGDDPNELLPARKIRGERRAPQITRGEAHTVAMMEDIDGRLWNENWSWEPAWKTFDRISERNGDAIKDIFYHEAKQATADSAREFKELQKRSHNLRKGLSGKSQRKIGIHALAKQAGGEAILEHMGLDTVPKLSPKELEVYNSLREEFRVFYDRVNTAREASGQTRFPAVDNYFTWINDMNWLRKEHGIGMLENWRTMQSKLQERQIAPSFRFAGPRGGDIPRKLELNPFTIFETYGKTALDTIHKAVPLAKMNELLLDRYGMKDNAPNTYNFLMEWREHQTGRVHHLSQINPTTTKIIRAINNNVVGAILAGNIRSALIQPSAFLGSFVELNHHLITGILKSADPTQWKRALQESNTLITRSPDVNIYESLEGVGSFRKVKKDIVKVGLTPLSMLDQFAAISTWLGAEAKAKKLGKDSPAQYADYIVDKTQATASGTDRAPIQRHIMGQTASMLQTFVLNHWAWLTRDVLGINNADRTNIETVARVMKYVVATAAINYIYEEGFNINSPLGTPLRSYNNTLDETDDSQKALVAGIKELLEYIPIIGGSIKYGTEIGGPLVNALRGSMDKLSQGEIPIKDAATLAGIPGTNQFSKSYRAYKHKGSLLDTILGRYIEIEKGRSPRKYRNTKRSNR